MKYPIADVLSNQRTLWSHVKPLEGRSYKWQSKTPTRRNVYNIDLNREQTERMPIWCRHTYRTEPGEGRSVPPPPPQPLLPNQPQHHTNTNNNNTFDDQRRRDLAPRRPAILATRYTKVRVEVRWLCRWLAE